LAAGPPSRSSCLRNRRRSARRRLLRPRWRTRPKFLNSRGPLRPARGMSLLCPIDFRYGRPKMKGIFEEESRLQRLLDVEAALARAEAKVGLIPEEAASEIAKKATTKHVTVKRVEELEEETRHDLMAVVLALTEACDDEAGKY